MSTRELKNLQSFLLQTTGQGERSRRLARRLTNRESNVQTYRQRVRARGRTAANTRSERAYMSGGAQQANYRLQTYEEVERTLTRYEDALFDGGRFIIRTPSGKHYTLTQSNYIDLKRGVNHLINVGYADDDGKPSDPELLEEMSSGGTFTIMNPSARAGGGYTFRGGAYFPYLHTYDCDYLTGVLADIGCFKKIDKENYKTNCLWNAFKSAGVDEKVLNAMKTYFLRRTISRKNIEQIARTHALRVELHSAEGFRKVQKYGEEGGHLVELALYHDHYIHLYKTKITKYAMNHYQDLKDKSNWWSFTCEKRRDEDRGMSTLNLLRHVVDSGFVHKIQISTTDVFKTQFIDKVLGTDFECLEYESRYSKPFHPKRDGGHEIELIEPIDVERAYDVIFSIKSRIHGMLPDKRGEKTTGLQKQHDKVRDILEFLMWIRGNGEGENKVRYYRNEGMGRLYAKGQTKGQRSKSLQGCFKDLRATLVGAVGHDIDIENSLPVITVQWLDRLCKEGLECVYPLLREYVEERARWLQEIMRYHNCSRDQAKTLILVTMFGGDPKNHLKELPKNNYRTWSSLKKLSEELKIVRNVVVNTHRDVLNMFRETSDKDDEALYRSVFSILTHEEEARCMKAMRGYLTKQHVEVYAIIHDGMILSKCDDELMRGSEEAVFDETGYRLTVAEKPLYGKQDDKIESLECIQDIVPMDAELVDMRLSGFVTFNQLVREIEQGREIKLEDRKEKYLHGLKNYGECPGLYNRADGDCWDIAVPGYHDSLVKKEYIPQEIIGVLFLSDGNHKMCVKIDEPGFDPVRCAKDIETYKKGCEDTKGITAYWKTNIVAGEDEEQDGDFEEKQEKLKAKLKKLRERESDHLRERLDKKVKHLKLGLGEEVKLRSKSRDVTANVFFDFEATTEESSDPKNLIKRCEQQILMTSYKPEAVLEKLKFKTQGMDMESKALLYQQECPHVAYQVCYETDDEDTTSSIGKANCAKDMLDKLTERYGVEMGPDDKNIEVPVIRMLAHNATYDLSFLWAHLTRSNYIERGTSVVCGSARHISFGSTRSSESGRKCPNGEVVKWMNTIGSAIYYGHPELGVGRSNHRGVWEKAVATVKKHETFIPTMDDFKSIHGIGEMISSVLETAPFQTFKETAPFVCDKVLDIRFMDSYKMIPMALAQFGKSFNIEQKKEVMPYKLYTAEFVEEGGTASLEQLRNVKDFNQIDELMQNLKDWECEVEGGYDMLKYSEIYCKADVKVLKNGYRVFRDNLLKAFDIDCYHYPTVSSLADALFSEQGCYEGVHKVAGVIQKFIAEASVGGRVMCSENKPRALVCNKLKPYKKSHADEEMMRAMTPRENELNNRKVADFDACGLYGSSMSRIPGFLKGKPKVWNKHVDLEKVDGYFIKIRVDKVGKKWKFPITRLKQEAGNTWTNDLEGHEIVVDKWTLLDLKRFSQIEFTILQGYYFDSGRNNKVNKVINMLYDMRREYKKAGSPLQVVLKLIMNAAYGITGLKACEDDIKYITDDKKDAFFETHFNEIKCAVKMTNNEWRFELYKQIDQHYNRQHVACEILSVSKNIMNEVMCLAEEIGATIWYTDTDSMHIDDEWVAGEEKSRLGRAFKRKYGRDLIGVDLGQFHTDFDMGSSFMKENNALVRCTHKCVGKLTATQSIFLGKKSYMDVLEDEGGHKAYHIRLKGIKTNSILHKCSEEYAGDPVKMFMKLFRGEAINFDLSAGGVCFKVNKNHTMSTVGLKRTVKF